MGKRVKLEDDACCCPMIFMDRPETSTLPRSTIAESSPNVKNTLPLSTQLHTPPDACVQLIIKSGEESSPHESYVDQSVGAEELPDGVTVNSICELKVTGRNAEQAINETQQIEPSTKDQQSLAALTSIFTLQPLFSLICHCSKVSHACAIISSVMLCTCMRDSIS